MNPFSNFTKKAWFIVLLIWIIVIYILFMDCERLITKEKIKILIDNQIEMSEALERFDDLTTKNIERIIKTQDDIKKMKYQSENIELQMNGNFDILRLEIDNIYKRYQRIKIYPQEHKKYKPKEIK